MGQATSLRPLERGAVATGQHHLGLGGERQRPDDGQRDLARPTHDQHPLHTLDGVRHQSARDGDPGPR